MPRKNTRQGGAARTVFHGYNREKSRASMFRDAEDRRYFKGLFERYLSAEPQFDSRGREYVNYRDRVHLWSLTIMGNHFHVVLFQIEPGGAGELMKAVAGLYVRYFNRKYGRSERMFNGEARLRPATGAREILNAVSYCHDNHGDHCYCEFCTHSLYVGHPSHVPSWVDVGEALTRMGGVDGYLAWLATRREQRRILSAAEGGGR